MMSDHDEFITLPDTPDDTVAGDDPIHEQRQNDPSGGNLETILRIPVVVQVVLGSASMSVANLLKIGRGAVIPLDRRIGESVEVTVNGRIVARGEVVVVEDDNSRFGVSLTEIVGPPWSNSNS